MADLSVHPAYTFGPREVITSDKLNLIASPVVQLSLTDPVNDQNFFRNGNFYSSFWTDPAGVSCPDNVWTTNASYWLCRPQGGATNFLRSSIVPDLYSLFSAEIQGALNVAAVEFGQRINGDLSATMRRNVTFSGYIYNASGLVLSPALQFYTADTFNDFSSITFRTAVNLQSGTNLSWTYVTATTDLSLLPNVANGLLLAVYLPAGTLNDTTKYVLFSRLKVQLGEVATEFVDDPSLFLQAPSVDSTMLQDGCIARSTLFMPNVIPTGAYQAKSINNGDINDGAIDGRCLTGTAVDDSLGYTPINKAGDSGIGPGVLDFTNDDVVGSVSYQEPAIRVSTTAGNASNDGYMPAISFHRPGVFARAIGMDTSGRFKTADAGGNIAYLLDSYFGVDNASYQYQSITYDKLAVALRDLICPVGMIMAMAGNSYPNNWAVCGGQEFSRTGYPDLFAVLGTYWGGGDGVSTFNVPNFINRTLVGAGASYGLGTYGGEATHQLSVAELASHGHAVANHNHSYIGPNAGGSWGGGSGWGPAAGTTGDAALNIQAAGGNVPHNNMPPFAGILYFIKVIR